MNKRSRNKGLIAAIIITAAVMVFCFVMHFVTAGNSGMPGESLPSAAAPRAAIAYSVG